MVKELHFHTDDLLLKLDFRDPEPEIIDISPQGGVVSSLKESKIECLAADKVWQCDWHSMIFDLFISHSHLGRLPVLFPAALSWEISRVSVGD
jgi:hypothetical protein